MCLKQRKEELTKKEIHRVNQKREREREREDRQKLRNLGVMTTEGTKL